MPLSFDDSTFIPTEETNTGRAGRSAHMARGGNRRRKDARGRSMSGATGVTSMFS